MALHRLIPPLLLALLFVSACDATPSDPLSERADLMALAGVDIGHGRAPAPLSLPGLLYSSVHRVYTEQGSGAARSLVGDLRRLQDEARAAHATRDREAATARLQAVHGEELGIVLRVFGAGVVQRVLTSVAADGVGLRRAVEGTATAGTPLPRAAELLVAMDAALAEAARADDAGRSAEALDAATRAAALADAVRVILVEARRIPTLEDLFDASVAALRGREDAARVQEALQRYDALRGAAEASVGSGDRQRAHDALRAVRDEQVSVVLRVLGADAVRRMLDAFDYSSADLDLALAQARRSGRDVSKLERMTGSARDLRRRAAAALAGGDAATALDLGSHAVGLLNGVRIALTGS